MHVAVGVIINSEGDVLIAERPRHTYKGGLWEFPGGKVEPFESVRAALDRELKEEINIDVIAAEPWLIVEYDYHDRKVLLDTWRVLDYSGEPCGNEGQLIRWVPLSMLTQFQFPDGNRLIIENLIKIQPSKL